MTLKTSLLITGDSTVARKAVEDLAKGVEKLGTTGKGAAGGITAVTTAEEAAANAAKTMAAAIGATNTAVREMAEAAKSASAALASIGASANGAGGAVEGSTRRTRQNTDAINDNEKAARNHAFGVRNFGQQVADTSIMIEGGISPMRAFSTQAAQMGFALSEMGGRAGAVGAFLTGPWGIALTVAVTFLGPWIEKLLEAGDAADQSAKAYKTAQDAIEALDAATGRAARNKEAEIGLIRTATREKLKEAQATLAEAQTRLARDSTPVAGGRAANFGASYAYELDKAEAQKAVAQAQKSVDAITRSLAGADVAGAIKRAEVATNAATAANERYRVSIDRLEGAFAKSKQTAADRAKLDRDVLATTKLREAELKKASSSGTSGGIATDARVASATGAIATARANLAVVTRDATAAEKAGTITRAEAVTQIAAAQSALDRAREATRAHAAELREQKKATSDAAREQEKFNQALEKYTRLNPLVGTSGLIQSADAADNRDVKRALTGPGAFEGLESIGDTVKRAEQAKAAAREIADFTKEENIKAVKAVADTFSDIIGARGGAAFGSLFDRLTAERDQDGNTAEGRQLSAGITKLAQGVGIDQGTIDKLAPKLGKAFAGAQTGALTNEVFKPLANALGLKTSKTGAQIGGAIGSAIPIPGGEIIGGIIGSTIGGLLKKTKSGQVTLTGAGDFSATGNSGAAKAAATGLAGSIQEGLNSIAKQLGGEVGAFNVTVGQRHGDYRVTTGSSLKVKNGAKDFNDDQAGATGYAIQLAVSQGAVTGLSAAVQKAIKSSSDINAALAEAIKVQGVEEIAKGITGQFDKAFADLEATAKERVRIAREYGLDVVAIEKRNAEDRVKLIEQLTQQEAGSLQALITDLTSGDLFEGSYTDKLAALTTRIDKAKADMEAGVEGSADTLADLYRQRLAAEKDAYGTTSSYAASRNTTIAEAQAAIAAANARIASAQTKAASDPALATTNAALDENNDQNAQIIAALQANNDLIAKLVGGGGGTGFDLSALSSV